MNTWCIHEDFNKLFWKISLFNLHNSNRNYTKISVGYFYHRITDYLFFVGVTLLEFFYDNVVSN